MKPADPGTFQPLLVNSEHYQGPGPTKLSIRPEIFYHPI